MPRIFYSQGHYLSDQAARFKKISRNNFLSVLGVLIWGFCLTIFLFAFTPDVNVRIVIFLMVASTVLLFCYVYLYDYSQFEMKSVKYRLGMSGEARVFRELNKLGSEYDLHCDVMLGKGGNIDFILRKGSVHFNIEVKNHAGEISFNGRELLCRGLPFPGGDPVLQLLKNENRISEYHQAKHLYSQHIISILVFANPKCWVNAPFKINDTAFILNLRGLLKLVKGF